MISILYFHGSLILFSHLLSSLSCSHFSSYIHVVHCGLFVVFTFINMSQGWSRQLVSDFTVVVGICFLPGPPFVVLGQQMDHSSSSKPPGWWVGVFKGIGWRQVMLVKISLVWGSGQSCLLDLSLLFSAYCWDLEFHLSLAAKFLAGSSFIQITHIFSKKSLAQVYWVRRQKTQFSKLFRMHFFNKNPDNHTSVLCVYQFLASWKNLVPLVWWVVVSCTLICVLVQPICYLPEHMGMLCSSS